ncbi:MAG: GNAT family N-acetyltransferase [Candidatus Zixiibacteriota bacterium]
MVSIKRTYSSDTDFQKLVSLLDQDLRIRDGAEHEFYAAYNKIDKIARALVAYKAGLAVGCGAIRKYSGETVEIKRMYVLPEVRRQGIAGAVLKELEDWSRELGFVEATLETGKKQPEAIRLYEKSGYSVIPNYGQYANVENSVCMKKVIRSPG